MCTAVPGFCLGRRRCDDFRLEGGNLKSERTGWPVRRLSAPTRIIIASDAPGGEFVLHPGPATTSFAGGQEEEGAEETEQKNQKGRIIMFVSTRLPPPASPRRSSVLPAARI